MLLELLVAGNILTATVIPGISGNDVILSNHTGLPIARIEIGEKTFSSDGAALVNGRILVSVSPHLHNMRVVFRGGADVVWHKLNFRGIHEITFLREQNKIEARIQ